MKNENLLLTLTSLLRYAFHRCCGFSGIAKCVYRLIYINVNKKRKNLYGYLSADII